MGLLYICKYRVPLGLSVYQLRALRLLHLMRNGVLCIFTFGPLGPVTFDLWGQDGQKALLRGRAHKCTTYGPQGLCSFSASLDRMMCLMEKEEKEEEKKPQDGKIPCMLLHAGITRRLYICTQIRLYPHVIGVPKLTVLIC